MATRAKRAHFPDEEPETETLSYLDQFSSTDCAWCGNKGHTSAECYERPLSDWIQTP